MLRPQVNGLDGNAGATDLGFAHHQLAVDQLRFEGHIAVGGGEDTAVNREDFRGELHGIREVTCEMGECSEKEIAEAMAREAFARCKAILEEFGEQIAVVGKGHQTVPNVARW